MTKAVLQSNLDFVFTPNGFIVDVAEHELTGKALVWKERFDADRYAGICSTNAWKEKPCSFKNYRAFTVYIRCASAN